MGVFVSYPEEEEGEAHLLKLAYEPACWLHYITPWSREKSVMAFLSLLQLFEGHSNR